MFTWIPIYTELAEKLLAYRDRQKELLGMIDDLKNEGLQPVSTKDKGKNNKPTVIVHHQVNARGRAKRQEGSPSDFAGDRSLRTRAESWLQLEQWADAARRAIVANRVPSRPWCPYHA